MKIRANNEFWFFAGVLPALFAIGGILFLGDLWFLGIIASFFPPMVLYLKNKKTG